MATNTKYSSAARNYGVATRNRRKNKTMAMEARRNCALGLRWEEAVQFKKGDPKHMLCAQDKGHNGYAVGRCDCDW